VEACLYTAVERNAFAEAANEGELTEFGRVAAVLHFDGDRHVTAAGTQVEVGNFKGTRGYVALVNNVAVLANGDLGVSFGNAADDWRKAFLVVRQHVIVRGYLHAAELITVKNVARGVAVAQRQQVFQVDE